MPPLIESNTGVAATQQGFLLQTLAAPERGIGILQVVLEFTNEIFEPSVFFDALQQIVIRDDLLRKKFVHSEDGFAESIEAEASVPTAILDWQNKSSFEVEVSRNAFLAADRRRGFNPSIAPLLRCTCIRLSNEHHLIVVTHHHLILDGIARDAVLGKLIALYDHARYGYPVFPLRRASNSALYGIVAPNSFETEAYWQTALAKLSKDSPLAGLRTGIRPDPGQQSLVQTDLSPTTTNALRVAAVKLGCPLSTLIYAAWAIVLNRVSQDKDIAFLTIRNARAGGGRSAREIGSFVNSVPLRIHVDRDASLAAIVAAVDSNWKSTLPYVHASLSQIKNWCGLGDRVWDNNFLFHHDQLEATLGRSAPPGARRSVRILEHSDVPLTVAVLRRRSLAIQMQYWTNAFRPGVVEEISASFTALLVGIAENPDRRIGDLPYLSDGQLRRLDEAASGPVDAERTTLLLHRDFEQLASSHPERMAIEWEKGSFTYGALDQAANALAIKLLSDGLTSEEPVAIFIERSAAHLVALFAVLKAGGSYLPLDPLHPDSFLRQIVASAGAQRCLTNPALAERARKIAECILPISTVHMEARASKPSTVEVRPNHLAYLIATSGTTGKPKIVELEHRAAANTLRHSVITLYAQGDLALIPWIDSPAGDAGIHQIFAPLSQGGTLVPIGSLDQLKLSFRFHDFTAFGATPSMLETLIAGNGLPPKLRAVIFGGEAYPDTLPERLRAATEIRRAVNVYGPTEAAIYCVADDIMSAKFEARKGNVIGLPITNTRVEVLDRDLQPVIPGALGEICITGINLARGYRNNPEKTQKNFVEATGLDGKHRRFYRSGDLGAVMPDGRLEFHGRIDRQVKISGVRIELDAVERVMEDIPDVHRALVAISPDSKGKQQLRAWVVPRRGITLNPSTIRSLARHHLPAAMVPRSVTVVSSIPINVAGKPDTAALSALSNEEPEAEIFEAFNEREALIAAEWRKLLKHESFGREDDFFEVGGDSLAGMELLLRLGELLGCGLSNASLHGRWSIAAIAAASRTAPPVDSFKLVGPSSEGPPIFWFMTNFADFDALDGIEAPQHMYLIGTDKVETDKGTFEDFAERIAERIRAIQPRGPYLLGGYCLGGHAAFQVAVQLTMGGAHVEKLGIVDHFGPSFSYRLLTRTYRFRDRYLPHSLKWLVFWRTKQWRRQTVQRGLHRLDSEWRSTLVRTFRPATIINSSTLIVETSHGRRRLNGFIVHCGWRKWINGEFQVERQPNAAPEMGIRRVLLFLSGVTLHS
jgi:microcystin synthetase protein McyB